MHTEIIDLTPDIARKLLEKVPEHQRLINAGRLGALTHALKAGTTIPHHQGLAVTPDGRLLDGQHRCVAVIETGITWPQMMITYDVPAAAFDRIDMGKPRDTSDLLTIMGVKNARKVVGPAQLMWCWERGRAAFQHSGMTAKDAKDTLDRHGRLQDSHLLNETSAEIRDALSFERNKKKINPLPASMAAVFIYLAADEAFVDDLADAFSAPANPATRLRQVVQDRASSGKRIEKRGVFALFVRMRNTWPEPLDKKPMWPRDAEAFPMAQWATVPVQFGARKREDDEDENE